MGDWNFDMSLAPKGETTLITKRIGKNEIEIEQHEPVTIIAAGNCGVVTTSRWIPKAERWNMFSKDLPPIAWMPWPEHPYETVVEKDMERIRFEASMLGGS